MLAPPLFGENGEQERCISRLAHTKNRLAITKRSFCGARGEAIEPDGFPFSKRVFRLSVQYLHRNLAVALGIPRGHNEPVLVQVDFIDEVLHGGVPHFRIVEIRMEEPVVVGPYRVLVLEERLSDRLGSYGVVQGFLACLKLGYALLRRLVEYARLYRPHEVGEALLNVPALLKAREVVQCPCSALVVFGRVHSD